MERKPVPHVEITIDPEKVEKSFSQVLKVIRPVWHPGDVIYELSPIEASKGLMNTMVKCYNKSNPKDAIMIRIPSSKLELWIDHDMEVNCIKYLQLLDCAPNIIAIFTNGFCYHFIHGEILSPNRLKEEPIWRLIATDIAKFHSVNPEELHRNKEKPTSLLEKTMVKLWTQYPEELKDPKKNEIFKRELPPKGDLKAELEELVAHCKRFNSPLVLCHNDTRAENIIWDSDKQRIHFVDFEAMNYDYQGVGIAEHFGRHCGLSPPDYSLWPSEAYQMMWLEFYLQEYYKFIGKNPSDVNTQAVRRLYVQVTKYHLLLLLLAGLAGPVIESLNILSDDQINMLELSNETNTVSVLKELFSSMQVYSGDYKRIL